MATSGESRQTYEIVVQATDAASQAIKGIGGGFQALTVNVDLAKNKVIEFGGAIAAISSGSVQPTFSGIAGSIAAVKRALESPVAKPFIEIIAQEAEAATRAIAPLSKILGDLADVSGSFGKGFFGLDKSVISSSGGEYKRLVQEISAETKRYKKLAQSIQLGADQGSTQGQLNRIQSQLNQSERRLKQLRQERDELDTIDAKVERVADKIGEALGRPFRGLEQSDNQVLSTLGRIAGAFDAALGDGLARSFAEALIQNPSLQQLAPKIVQDIVGGGSVFKPIADALGFGSGPVTVPVLPEFSGEGINKFLANLAIDKAIESRIGDNFLSGIVKKAVRPAAALVGPEFAKELAAGSFTGAVRSVFTGDFTRLFADTFKQVDGIVSSTFERLGGTAANRLIEGPSLAFKKFLAQRFSAADTIFEGTTGAAVSGSQVLKLFPGLDQLDGLLGERLSGALRRSGDKAISAFVSSFLRDKATQLGSGVVAQGLAGFLPEQVRGVVSSALSDTTLTRTITQEGAKIFQDLPVTFGLVTKQFQSFIAVVQKSFADLSAFAKTALAPITDTTAFQATAERVKKAFDGIKESAGGQLFESAKQQFQGFGSSVSGFFENLSGGVRQGLGAIGDNQVFRQIVQGALQAGEAIQSALVPEAINDKLRQFVKTGAATFSNLGQSFIQSAGPAFQQIDGFFEGLFSSAFSEIGGNAGRSFSSGFSRRVLAEISPVINQIDSAIVTAFNKIRNIPQGLNQGLEVLNLYPKLMVGLDEPLEVFGALKAGAAGATSAILDVTENLFFFQSGLQALQQLAVGGPYETLIGQNVKLREQLLATQSTLAATNQVLSGGARIDDPTQAIQALQGPVENAIANIRKGSLELVNVTSKDLVESFQVVAGEAGNIGFSLQDASELTLSFGATLGTLGVPLFQARQEITSILQGTIDQNSIVAKSLGIQNQQVQSWRQQGTLVENLIKRMEAFRAGNSLAAQTLGGVTSNIQELIDEIGRLAGEQLLDPIVQQAGELYKYLNQNKEVLIQIATDLTKDFLDAGLAIVDAVKTAFDALQPILAEIPGYLTRSLANTAIAIRDGVRSTVQVLQPAINLLGQLAQAVGPVAGQFLELFFKFKILQLGISGLAGGFGTVAKIIPGLGELMFFLQGRTSGVVNQFSTLSGIFGGPGAAGFLLLGKNLGAIPGLANAAAGALGPLGPLVVGLIPGIAGFGIQAAGLIKIVPGLSGVLQNVLALSPGLVGNVARLAGTTGVLGGALAPLSPILFGVADQMKKYSNATSLASVVNQKFQQVAIETGKTIAKQVLNFGLLAAGLFILFKAFDEFVLKNESVRRVLLGVGEVVRQVAGFIGSVLSNPIFIAVGAVTALAIAFKVGLIPQITRTAIEFGKLAFTQIAENFRFLADTVNSLRDQFAKASVNIGATAGLAGSQGEKIKQEAEGITQSFREGTQKYKQAIAERKAAIAELEDQITAGRAANQVEDPFAPQVDVEGLERQKSQIEGEIQQLRDNRRKEADNVGARRKDAKRVDSDGARTVLADKLRTEAEDIRQSLEQGRLQFEEEVSQRRAKLAELDQLAGELKAKGDSGEISQRKVQKDTAKIDQEKAAIAAEIAEITDFRARETKKADDLDKRAKKLSKPQVQFDLRDTVQRVQSGAGQIVAAIQDIPGTFDKTKASFRTLGENAGAAMETLKSRVQGAGTAIATGFNAAKGAITAFLATAGPILALTAAIAIAASVYDNLSKINDAATASAKRFTQAVQEQLDKLDELERRRAGTQGTPSPEGGKTTEQLQAEGLKKAQEERDFITKGLDSASQGLGSAGAVLAQIPGVGAIGSALGGASEGIKSTGIFTGEAKLRSETEGFGNTIQAAEDKTVELANERYRNQVRLETDLANLQKRRSEAAAQGNDAEVKSLDEKIKLTQESVDQGKNAVQSAIDALAKEIPLTKEQAEEQRKRLKVLAEVKTKYDEIAQAAIKGIELPELGSAGSQLRNQVTSALDDLNRGTGKKEDVEAKLKTALGAVQQLQELGQISEADAAAIYTQIANSSKISADLQIQAQQGVTKSLEQQSKERSDVITGEIAAIEASVLKGEITQVDAESQITAKKIEQLNIRLEAVRATAAEENRIRAGQLQNDLANLDRLIGDARTRAEDARKRLNQNPEDKQAQQDLESAESDITTNTNKRAQAQADYENAVKESNQRLAATEADTQKQITQAQQQEVTNRLSARNTEIQNATTREQAAIEEAAAKGEITKSEATKRGAAERIKAIDDEVAALQEALNNPNLQGPERDKIEAQLAQKRADRAKTAAAEETRQLESATKKALEVAKTAETERLINTQKLLNAGVISEAEANQLRVRSNQDRIRAEIEAEKTKLTALQKNPNANDDEIKASRQRILDLTKSALEEEQRAYDAQIAVVKQKIQTEENIRVTAIKKRVLEGKAVEEQAEVESARANVERIEAELALETKNKDKRAQLELDLVNAKIALRGKETALRERQLKNEAQIAENVLKAQEIGFQKQLILLDALNKALDLRQKLLQAGRDLNTAQSNFASGQIDAIAATEKSEIRKRELAQISAQIKLQALEKEQEIAQQVLEIEIQRNRLAIERKQIENQSAILKKQGELIRGDANIKTIEAKVASGQATRAELQAARAEQEGRKVELSGLVQEGQFIQKEKAMQAEFENLSRRKLQFEQASQRSQAQLQAFQTLSPGDQARLRGQFQKQLLEGVYGGQFSSREELVRGVLPGARSGIEANLTGRGPSSKFEAPGITIDIKGMPGAKLNASGVQADGFDKDAAASDPGVKAAVNAAKERQAKARREGRQRSRDEIRRDLEEVGTAIDKIPQEPQRNFAPSPASLPALPSAGLTGGVRPGDVGSESKAKAEARRQELEAREADRKAREEAKDRRLARDLEAFDKRGQSGGKFDAAVEAGDRAAPGGRRLTREEFLRSRGASDEQVQRVLGGEKDKDKKPGEKDGKDKKKGDLDGKSVNFNISNSDVKFNLDGKKKEGKDGKDKKEDENRKLTPEERKEADAILKKGLFGGKDKDKLRREKEDERKFATPQPIAAPKQDDRELAIARPISKPGDSKPGDKSGKPGSINANFSIIINAQDKELGKRIQTEVRKGLDNVLKQAARVK